MRSAVPSGGEIFVALSVLLLVLFLLLDWPTSPPQTSIPAAAPIPGPVEFFLSQSELLCVIEDSAGRRRLLAYDSILVLSYSRPLEELTLGVALDSAGELLWHSAKPGKTAPVRLEAQPELRRIRIFWHFPWRTASLPPGQHLYRLRLQASYTVGRTRHTEQLMVLLRISLIAASSLPPPLTAERTPPSPLRLVPTEPLLEVPPHSSWETELVLFGMNALTDLASAPQLLITGATDGKATVSIRTATSLLLRGTAPSAGQMQVTVTLTRRSDGERATVHVSVVARPLPQPEVPAEMYPERTYMLDPRLQLRGQAVRVELHDGQHLWASSTAGTPLSVTPRLSDTGTTLTLRRFINAQLLDEVPIPIRDFPAPELVEVRPLERNTLQVRTRCFGTVRGEPNLCSVTLEGTGTVRELYGNRRRRMAEPYGLLTEQTFLLEGATPPFELLLSDRAGRQMRWRR